MGPRSTRFQEKFFFNAKTATENFLQLQKQLNNYDYNAISAAQAQFYVKIQDTKDFFLEETSKFRYFSQKS